VGRLVVLAVVFFSLAGVAAGQSVVGIGEQSVGTTVRLHRDDILALSLGANASTGYSWKLAAVDRSVLRPDASTYLESTHPPGMVGSGGVSVLTFKAVAAGRTALRLAYVGPGRNAPTDKRFSVSVVVVVPR
jgi:inhibitor of cysteine peptidase